MPIMPWDQTLDIGIEDMDRDHREILDTMNHIFDTHSDGHRGEHIIKLVDKLGAVAARHFAAEEQAMAEMGFPGLRVHKIIHEQLLADFNRHSLMIQLAGGAIHEDFFGFLRRWLTAHIKGFDMKYGSYALTAAE